MSEIDLEGGSAADFARMSKEPKYWIDKARSMHAAAGAVWYCTQVEKPENVANTIGGSPDFSCGAWQVYRMLCGFSLELAFKAILVVRREPVSTTHDLVRLADESVVMYTDKQKELLALLTECVIWEGRYPVPKRHEDIDRFVFWHYETLFRKVRMGERSWTMEPIEPHPLDWDQFNELWQRAEAAYDFFAS